MLNIFLKRINNKKGFTLVELVVVIAILAILASIAVPKFTKQTKQAENVANQATARTIAGVVTMIIADKDEKPTADDINDALEGVTVSLEGENGWVVKFKDDSLDFEVVLDGESYYPPKGKTEEPVEP